MTPSECVRETRHRGVERADGGAQDSLGRAAAGLGVDYLTVKIGQFDDVGVGEGETTDARAGG